MNRTERLLGVVDRSQLIIELGAGYNPIAPKADGWNTHVVDHTTRDELRTKYATAAVDVGVIEDVDTVWQGGPLDRAVPAALLGQVDLIIASHVLEHIPDLIGFFSGGQSSGTPWRPVGSGTAGPALLFRLPQALDDNRGSSGGAQQRVAAT